MEGEGRDMSAEHVEGIDVDMADTITAPEQDLKDKSMETSSAVPKRKGPRKLVLKRVTIARKWRRVPRSSPDWVASYQRSGQQSSESDEETWVQTRLVACLRFSTRGCLQVEAILAADPANRQGRNEAAPTTPKPAVSQKFQELPHEDPVVGGQDASDAVAIVSTKIPAPTGSDSNINRTPGTLAPLPCQWLDESVPFNMKDVRSSLRDPNTIPPALPPSYTWFPDAVPIDAIFPPGMPITAKEIMAFYPHHIRRKGIAHRLVNNGYLSDPILGMQSFFRGTEQHPLRATDVNQFFRDTLKRDIPGFKTSGWLGQIPDRNLYPGDWKEGATLGRNRQTRGAFVPTLEELLRGVVYLPGGLDARGLTQCLAWYTGVREKFTPQLQLNVLHVQALSRALQMPLRTYEPQNLDMMGLQEWKNNEKFARKRVEDEVGWSDGADVGSAPNLRRSRVTINPEAETLDIDIVVKLRHVLTFPHLAICGMVCRALELGIAKAEARRAMREAQEAVEESAEPRDDADTAEVQEKNTAETNNAGTKDHPLSSMPAGYKIPKRKRPLPDHDLEEMDHKRSSSGLTDTPILLRGSISERREAIAPAPLTLSATYRDKSVAPSPYTGPTTAPAGSGNQRGYGSEYYPPASYHQSISYPQSAPYRESLRYHQSAPYHESLRYHQSRSSNRDSLADHYDHYRPSPYSSTFADHYHPSPYSSTFRGGDPHYREDNEYGSLRREGGRPGSAHAHTRGGSHYGEDDREPSLRWNRDSSDSERYYTNSRRDPYRRSWGH